MSAFAANDRPEGEGGLPIPDEQQQGGRPRDLRELFGAAKQDVAEPPVFKRKKRAKRRVDPGRAWSDERKAAQGARIRAWWAARKAGGPSPGEVSEGESEAILEVGADIPPPPPAKEPKPESIQQLCDMLFIVHVMMSGTLKIPELQLDKKEARELAAAYANVARHYQWGKMAEKTKDWCLLTLVTGTIYVPRFKAVRARARKPGLPQQQVHSPTPSPSDEWEAGASGNGAT